MARARNKLCHRFIASTRGVAAIEFAIVAPVLLLMLIETFDIGNGIAVYMKVRTATFALASITNQYSTGPNAIQTTDMTAVTGSASAILAPYSSTPVTIKISQIRMSSATRAKVSWSYALNGQAYATGKNWQTLLPTQFTASNACNSYPCYLIYAEVSYAYAPVLFSSIMSSLNLSDSLYVMPRSSACVQYNSVPTTC
jgi:Flp pilus assembly protein TadG